MVDLYAIKVPETLQPNVFERLLTYLDEAAQVRIRKFRLEGDAIRSLFGRISIIWYLLTIGLITRVNLPNLRFGVEGNDKPIIVEPKLEPRVEYNISHDHEHVLLGISRTGKIGVDLMSIPANPADIEEALSDQMTISERRGMTIPLSTRQKSERLTTLWCVKEAYVKAIGEGVGFGMDRIDVGLDDEGKLKGVRVDQRPLSDSGWNVEVGYLDGEYIWACVSKGDQTSGSSEKIIPKMVDHQDIIDSLLPS